MINFKEILESKGLVATDEQIAVFESQCSPEIENKIVECWNDFVKQRKKEESQKEDDSISEKDSQTTSVADAQTTSVADAQTTSVADAQTTSVTAEAQEESATQNPNHQPPTTNPKTPTPMPIFEGQKKSAEEQAQLREAALEAQIKGRHITFPNGKAQHFYRAKVELSGELADIRDVRFEGLEAFGLSYNAENHEINGIPTKAGEHKVQMFCKFASWTEGDNRPEYIPKDITLIINPDPRSLWNNIPTPTDIEYFKPDEDKAFVKVESHLERKGSAKRRTRVERKDIVAASQRGRSHAHEGRARDDDFAIRFDEATDWYTVVVADGAGSARYSRRGAQIACRTAADVLQAKIAELGTELETNIASQNEANKNNAPADATRKLLGNNLYNILGAAAFKALKEIEVEAKHGPNPDHPKLVPIKDYSTTLLMAIAKKFDFGWFVGTFWVGDGGIGIYRQDPQYLKIMGEPDGGEYAGQTRFLTMPEIMQPAELMRRLRFDIVEDFTALILMTDGVTDPKFETDANLSRIEKWHALWDDLNGKNEDNARVDFSDDNEAAAEQLLRWLDFWSKGNHDDRTIAILF